MSILSTSSKLVRVGDSYSAGEGISIDNNVISVTGDYGHSYSAGENISISDDNVISSKDWSSDIDTAAQNVSAETTAWVSEQGYITDASLSDYALITDLETTSGLLKMDIDTVSGSISGKMDTTAFNNWQTGQYSNDIGGLSNDIQTVSGAVDAISGAVSSLDIPTHQEIIDASGYAYSQSTAWCDSQGYLTEHQDISNLATKDEVSAYTLTTTLEQVSGDIVSQIPSTAGLATTGQVDTASSFLSGAIDYVSAHAGDEFPASANDAITAYQTYSGTYLTKSSADTLYQPIGSYALQTDLENVSGDIVGLIPDVSNFITNTSAETTYQPIGNYASASDITGFATKTELETTSGEIVGLIPSTAGLATETDLQIVSGGLDYVSGALTGYQPVGSYATTGELDTASSFLSGAIDYISGVAVTSTAGLATTGDLVQVSGEITGLIPSTAGLMQESELEISDNKITGYNGTAFAGQGGGSVDTIPVAVISPLVTGFSGESAYLGIESTALNLSSYVPVSAIGVNSQGYVSGISGKNISAYYSRNALTANYANTAGRAYQDRGGNEISSYYQPKLTIAGSDGTITAINNSAIGGSMTAAFELSAGAGISITDDLDVSATVISVTAAGGNPEVESYVQTNSASIDDAVSTYQTNSATYLTSHQAISANEWNSVYDTVESNSSTWTGGGTAYTGDAQGALDEVYTNSGKWITSSFNGYIKTTGFKQGITYGTNALYFSANSTGNPGITLYGNQGSAFYKENQLQLTRDGKKISFNIGAAGSTITADAAQTTGDGGIYLWNKNNSAYYNQNGIKLRNSASTASTAFIGYNEITSWNGYASDISYISGVVGDVETLLASL